jgi:hypothetical protein
MQTLTFRSSRIIYYGPHTCSNCGVIICKMGHEFGGNAFTYPDGPIYPNTEWHPHVCDPKKVAKMPRADQETKPDGLYRNPEYHSMQYPCGCKAAGPIAGGPLPDYCPEHGSPSSSGIPRSELDGRHYQAKRAIHNGVTDLAYNQSLKELLTK